ncbi:MAG TPA: NADH-quinone oxidoreductase subunit C [Anaeromyxobacter sp.]
MSEALQPREGSSEVLETWNGEAVRARDVPVVAVERFRRIVLEVLRAGGRLSALFGRPAGDRVLLTAVLADDPEGKLGLLSTEVSRAYPSISAEAPAAQGFEREIAEQWGVRPDGHPWLKPLRFEPPLRDAPDAFGRKDPRATLPGEYPFFRVEGEEVHEVAVGPVHAGIIEPGHFRFQCHGEKVFHLEIVLGYQHRGVEAMLRGGPDRRSLVLAESIAGDTAVGHGLAYVKAVESLSGHSAAARAMALRGVGLELERVANHVGDLGALAGDVGFLPTASYCGALRADFLNALAELCGSRFGRSLLAPGGVKHDLRAEEARALAGRVRASWQRVKGAASLMFESPSVRARFEGTGTVTRETALELGLVGPAARASGVDRDVRRDHAFGIYRFVHVPVTTAESGDVLARALVRLLESERSVDFAVSQLENLPEGEARGAAGPLAPGSLVVSLVEGWRGEIAHVALTDAGGRFERYKVKDPSFHNWLGLAMALRDGQISDFPLCNKSFNLSYAGHDL